MVMTRRTETIILIAVPLLAEAIAVLMFIAAAGLWLGFWGGAI
jgi:hypothetical protein